ncbi:MAG: 3'-5' exonuclease [Bacteroidales bacterium]|nr:3'-5' exonuclease [Bacteroidales bacterium]
MRIQLRKPIVFFDLETTGINIATDRIVEISIIKVHPNGNEQKKTYRINPEMPIPPQSTAVHGISDADVANCPTFKQIAKEMVEIFKDSDIAGYNSNKFDVPLLAEEFIRAGVDFDLKKRHFVDVMSIFMKKEPRNLSAAYKFYCNADLENAHSANADTEATYEVFKAQVDRYSDIGNDIAEISKFSSYGSNADFMGRFVYDADNNVVVNFGKYKGQLLTEVFKKDPAYYDWMMKGDFPLYTKKVLADEYMKYKMESKK